MNKISLTLTLILLFSLTAVCQMPNDSKKVESTGLPKIIEFEKPNRIQIKPSDLPVPFESKSALRPSKSVPQDNKSTLHIPKGFKVNVYAEGEFVYPRWMALAPNGDVFVADSRANKIIVLRDKDKDGVADERFTFAENLAQPFGMAFNGKYFFVANTDSVVRFSYKSGQTKADGAPEKIIELTRGGYNQHWTRNILFSPDGKKLFVSIGSETNASVESDQRRAAISVFDAEGKNHRIFASGLRNPIGLAWNPANGELWTAVNERDGLGDDLVPDYVTSVKDGGFYGFPFSYIGQNEEPRRKGENPELVKQTIVPDVLVASHSAALGIVFYNGKMFPKEFHGDAFVAFHGSWNREKLTGYKVIRIKFKNGKLVDNSYEDFVSGWLPDENSNEVWGRPVGLLVLNDGSLLITDDGGKKIWRISYKK